MPIAWWPSILPPALHRWNLDHVEALRVVVRYLYGMHTAKQIFSDQNLNLSDVDNFKRKHPSNFSFPHAKAIVKLEQMRTCVYDAIKNDIEDAVNHDCIEHQLRILFVNPISDASEEAARQERLTAAAMGLYKLVRAYPSDISKLARVACGAYHLYRCGDLERMQRQVVRTAVRIYRWGGDRVVFDMKYLTRKGGTYEGLVRGLVMPHEAGFFSLAGIDLTSTDSPCLYIFRSGSHNLPPEVLDGMMLRINTRGRIVAARVVLHRQSTTKTDTEAFDDWYDNASADITSRLSDASLLRVKEIVPHLGDLLNNSVDNSQRYVLLDTIPSPKGRKSKRARKRSRESRPSGRK